MIRNGTLASFLTVVAGLGLAIPLVSGDAFAIDCGKAALDIERAICASPRLVEMDETMNRAYQELLRGTPEKQRDALRISQRIWLLEDLNNVSAGQPDWISRAVGDRILFLSARPRRGPGPSGKLVPFIEAVDRDEKLDFSSVTELILFVEPKSKGEMLFNDLMRARSNAALVTRKDVES